MGSEGDARDHGSENRSFYTASPLSGLIIFTNLFARKFPLLLGDQKRHQADIGKLRSVILYLDQLLFSWLLVFFKSPPVIVINVKDLTKRSLDNYKKQPD